MPAVDEASILLRVSQQVQCSLHSAFARAAVTQNVAACKICVVITINARPTATQHSPAEDETGLAMREVSDDAKQMPIEAPLKQEIRLHTAKGSERMKVLSWLPMPVHETEHLGRHVVTPYDGVQLARPVLLPKHVQSSRRHAQPCRNVGDVWDRGRDCYEACLGNRQLRLPLSSAQQGRSIMRGERGQERVQQGAHAACHAPARQRGCEKCNPPPAQRRGFRPTNAPRR